jgi:hypothetical protein
MSIETDFINKVRELGIEITISESGHTMYKPPLPVGMMFQASNLDKRIQKELTQEI